MSEKLEKEPLLSYKNGVKQGNKKQKSLDDNAILELVGLRWSLWRAFLFYTSSFLTAGVLLLVSFWFPKFYAYGRKCDTRLRTATFAFIKGADKEWEEVKITDLKTDANVDRICDGVYSCFVENGTMRVFDFRNLRFAYDFKKDTFRRPDFDLSIPFIDIKKRYANGIRDKDHYEFFMQLFGANEIELPIPTILEMIFDEIFHPFYIFQMLSIALWYAEGYIYYPIAILFISTISLVWTLYSTRKNLVNLRELAKSECDISLFRYGDSEPITLNSRDVAPGDIVEIKDEMLLPCDMIIISGECVMNESMLTGESNPVLKYTIPSIGDIYNSHTHKKFTLFCGTKVMQVKPTSGSKHVLGLVAHTGFHTAKGALFYSILFPKPIKFKFYSDSYKFLFVMILVAIASFAWTLYHLLKISYSLSDIVFNALDLITIAVPPALPLILTIGIEFSVQRLTKKEIFCTAPSRVNYAGKIDMMCFDKTGTITEDDLALHRIQNASEKGFEDPMEDVRLMKKGPLLNTMVAAHAISKVNGNFMGHPVDVRMFESTKWDLRDAEESEKYALQTVVSSDSSEKLHILRRFEFEPSLQRMSVIVKETDGRIMLCTKGSPEALKALSNQKTIPYNFEAHLREFAKQGVYVIGCAYRYLDIEDSAVNALKRDALEENLTFCGLLIFSNKLKSDSVDTIYQLKKANIDVRMITGDNIHTAIAVGRQTDIIDPNKNVYIGDVDENGLKWTELDDPEHPVDMQELFKDSDNFELALTGKALKLLFVGKKVEVIEHAKIFARTSPDQKAQITEHFVERGKFVGMCGDGTNDCGALKVAHIGLALSDAEASVVAPFTSKKKVIGDVVKLIAEGRCALHTSFVAFKYMMMYPLIQLMSALILLNSYSILGDFQYLYTDIWLTLPLAIFMTWTEPPNKLSSRRPTSSLFNPRIMLSLALQILFNVGAIVGINVYLHYQPWFIPNTIGKHDHTIESTIQCEENFTTFLFANFPYIISAVALNNNTPFRRPFWTNPLFLITILVTWTTSSLLVLLPQASKLTELQITPTHEFPFFWRWEIWIAAWITLVAAYGAESLLVEGPITRAISRKFKQRRLHKERQRKLNAHVNLVIQ